MGLPPVVLGLVHHSKGTRHWHSLLEIHERFGPGRVGVPHGKGDSTPTQLYYQRYLDTNLDKVGLLPGKPIVPPIQLYCRL